MNYLLQHTTVIVSLQCVSIPISLLFFQTIEKIALNIPGMIQEIIK